MTLSDDDPAARGESPGATIARLETAVSRLRQALARRQTAATGHGEGALAAENAKLRQERDRLQHELSALHQVYERLKARSDSAGTTINRTIRELEFMLGEGADGARHG